MNYPLIFKLAGNMLRLEAALMIFPLITSLIYKGNDELAFTLSILILLAVGTLLTLLKPKDKTFRTKDAFAAASLSWVLLSIFGALPYCFSGCFNSLIDCIFESVSGFSTTGSTVLTNIEILPEGLLFWRSLSQWVGGMGVLLFMLAVIPGVNASSVNLLRAETTGPAPNKIVPRIRETAKIMYFIYCGMTALLVILLLLSGLSLYDSLINSFAVAGTGGFSNLNQSIGGYNNAAAEIIMTVFMFLFSINFTLYFFLLKGNLKRFFKDEELRLFFGIVIVATAIITADITGIYGSISEALRHSSFQVSSIISTTGFATTDYNLWPTLSRIILVSLMLVGGCAGSTGGGIKVIRFLLLFKAVRIELDKFIHPRSVKAVTFNHKKIEQDVTAKVALFFFVYIMIFIVCVILISIERADIVSSATSVIASLSNIGPGLEAVGPVSNYSAFSPFSKIVLSFCMIAGRLEIFPVLILFKASIWKRGAIN